MSDFRASRNWYRTRPPYARRGESKWASLAGARLSSIWWRKYRGRHHLHQFLKAETRPIWTPWGWAVDRSRLTWLIVNWCFRNRKCFTCQFRSQYRRTRRDVFPILSRIQNVGYELGENGRTPEWYRENHRAPWVAGLSGPSEFVLASPTNPLGRDI